MDSVRWDPFKEIEEVSDRLNRVFNRPLMRPAMQEALVMADWTPLVDIVESDKEYLVKAELPEVPKEGVKVEIREGVLLRGQEARACVLVGGQDRFQVRLHELPRRAAEQNAHRARGPRRGRRGRSGRLAAARMGRRSSVEVSMRSRKIAVLLSRSASWRWRTVSGPAHGHVKVRRQRG